MTNKKTIFLIPSLLCFGTQGLAFPLIGRV
jgi:hypothetical protein